MPRVVHDELATRRFAEEVLLRDGADRGVDVHVGVAVLGLAVRQREAARAEHQDRPVAETEVLQQHAADVADVAGVVRRRALVDQGGDGVVALERPRVDRAVELYRHHAVARIGRVDPWPQPQVAHADQRQHGRGGQRRASAAGAHQPVADHQQRRAHRHRRRHAQPLHHPQRQRHRAEEGAERRVVQRVAARLAGPGVLHQVGEDGHGLAQQPRQRTQHGRHEGEVGQPRRRHPREQPVHAHPRQPHPADHRRPQEVARHGGEVVPLDLGPRVVPEGQREQEQPDRRGGDDDGAAQVRHELPQREHLGAERAEALDEDDGVELRPGQRGHGHGHGVRVQSIVSSK